MKKFKAKAGWIIVLLAMGASLLGFSMGHKMSATRSLSSITAVLSGKLTLPLAPENISTIPLYHVHTNLWGTVLAEHGKPGLARLLDVSNDSKLFRFELLQDARFSNGRKITSDDVLYSFQRLMNKQSPGHFSAKSLIERIQVESPTRFQIALKEKTGAFLFLLASPEMGIVPKESCDSDGNLSNLQITSGPYVVDGSPQGANQLILRKNTYYVGLDPHSPDQVTVLFRSGTDALLREFDNDHADFVELYSNVPAETVQKLRQRQDIDFKVTRPSYSVFIAANAKNLSSAQRVSIAGVVREKLNYSLNSELERRSSQILPPGTFGSLDDDSIPIPTIEKQVLPAKVRIASFDKSSPLLDAIVAALKSSGVSVEIIPFGEGSDFDLAFLGQGMNTDFPEIEFYLNMLSEWAFISATPEEKQLIMNTIHSSSRAERAMNIERVGRSLLEDARVIPLLVRSYVHISRKATLSIDEAASYDGDIPFWRMQEKGP